MSPKGTAHRVRLVMLICLWVSQGLLRLLLRLLSCTSSRGIWPGQLLFFSYNVEGPKPWTWDPVLVFKTFSYDFIDSIR